MNITEIKEQLPGVKVLYNNKIYNGQILGRTLKFPMVTIRELNVDFEVAWETLESCINKNRPIIY